MIPGPVVLSVIANIVVVVGVTTIIAALVVVGRDRLAETYNDIRRRSREIGPYLLVLVLVVWVAGLLRTVGTELSWTIGWNLTGEIYDVEREFVAMVQTVASPLLTSILSFFYVYGYVFLLVFPLAAYFALPDSRPFKRLAVAYGANYVIGVLLYTLVIAYGPRNVLPGEVDPLLYAAHPEFHVLTSQVNTNTNVFPSLHTSLSVTVAAFAWRTRDRYPRWVPLAMVLATGVVVSTVYLGIHWGVDVLAGTIVGLGCVHIADALVERLG